MYNEISCVNKTVSKIVCAVKEIFCDSIVANAFVYLSFGRVLNRNWGDDINYYFLSLLFRKSIIAYDYSSISHRLEKNNYMMIGSSITLLCNRKTVIWGSGVIDPEAELPARPKKVLAVRGPLTRQYLIDRGVECPAIYGDPALLLPYVYVPKVSKKYKLGIVPHYSDFDSVALNNLRKRNDVLMIRMEGYNQWTDVIDQINSCECIISSSLHGLIVAEAYGVPSQWISVDGKLLGGNYKFLDFYASIGKEHVAPIKVNETTELDYLCEKAFEWKKGHLNLEPMVKACPFKMYFSSSSNLHLFI